MMINSGLSDPIVTICQVNRFRYRRPGKGKARKGIPFAIYQVFAHKLLSDPAEENIDKIKP